MRFLILSIFILLLVSCTSPKKATEPVAETGNSLGDTIHLAYQQELSISSYKISFTEIEHDSRCPKGVSCFTEGKAAVTVQIDNGTDQQNHTFHLRGLCFEGNCGEEKKVGEHSLSVLQLLPYPESGVVKDKSKAELLLVLK